jgi:hypothetical protein
MPKMIVCAALLVVGASSQVRAAPVTAGNDYYVVVTDPARNGAYAVGTGPAHPVTLQEGVRSNVLKGGFNSAGISFNSLRSYASGTDYLFGMPAFIFASDPGFECVAGSEAASPTITMISDGGRDVGIALSWEIHRGADDLFVEQRVVARGDAFTRSAAEVTLTVTNLGVSDAALGLRYTWVWALGNAGGASYPTIAPKPPEVPTEPYLRLETEFDHPDFRSFIVSLEDTPSNPGPIDDNAYVIEATMGGVPLDPPPTPPNRYLHTVYGELLNPANIAGYGPLNSCFGYNIADPPRVGYRGPSTAGVYFWGDTRDSARHIAPGETVSVTQYVFAYLDFPLVCDAGVNRSVECVGNPTPALVDGASSDNVTGEGLDYLWTSSNPGVVIEDPTLEETSVDLPGLGSYSLDLLVHQGPFATACSTELAVEDTAVPMIRSALATPSNLWPPDHQMVRVEVSLEAFDACDDSLDIRLLEVISSEPSDVRRGGDGQTSDDIHEADLGTADFSVLLRAERQGGRAGRLYTLLYEVRDTSGNVTTVPVTVSVAHDQRPSRRR